MPYDALSLVTLTATVGLLLVVARARAPLRWRVALILFAALLLRADAAYQRSLHVWDESFHALVAKNLMTAPLRPMLYRDPAVPYDPADWTSNHIWLHKPPGALWLMAGSMSVFGTNEVALRVPSVLESTASVLLTFLIGRQLVSGRAALLAAGFHAVNGFLIALAAGRRVADHVDTALILFVQLGVWAAVCFRNTRHPGWLLLAGAATGLGLLTKTWPALIVLPVAWVLFVGAVSWRRAVRWCLMIFCVAAGVAAPWVVMTWVRYPVEAAAEAHYTFRHMSEVVEGHRLPWWTYVADLPRFFGELTVVGIAIAAAAAFRNPTHRDVKVLLVWAGVTYVVFSASMTRLPAYVMIAAPAIFLLHGVGVESALDRLRSAGRWRLAGTALLGLAVLLPGRHLLEPSGPLEKRDRSPAYARRLELLEARLGLPDAVLFNVPKPIDAMFYSRYTAYERLPTDSEVRELIARGRQVVIYQPADRRVAIPTNWKVIELKEME